MDIVHSFSSCAPRPFSLSSSPDANCGLAGEFHTLHTSSEFPALSNQKWVVQVQGITSYKNRVNGFCFKCSRIGLAWKHLSKFSSPGDNMHGIIKMAVLSYFSNLSPLINEHIWLVLSWNDHYNRVRGKLTIWHNQFLISPPAD